MDCVSYGVEGASGDWTIANSTFDACRYGLHMVSSSGAGSLSVSGTQIVRSEVDGIKFEYPTAAQLDVHDCVISHAGGVGISANNRTGGTVRITDSLIEGCVGDGITLYNSAGCVTATTADVKCLVAG